MADKTPSFWLSPSQISTFRQCKRKWAWSHLDGIKLPPNAAAQEGLRGHKILENYFRNATVDMSNPLADLVTTGLHHYPAPNTMGLQIEHHFGLVLGGFHLHGYKDLQLLKRPVDQCPGCSGLGGELCDLCIPQIWDHKFTSDLKWAKTVAELLYDPQCVIYALDAMLSSGYHTARCNWIYYQRRGARRNQKVQVVFDVCNIVYPLLGIVKTAHEIDEARSTCVSAKQLDPSVDQCNAYGGCVYRQNCGLTPEETFVSLLKSHDF